jgi:hypothetical protein
MPYLFAITLLGWIHLIATFRSMARGERSSWPNLLALSAFLLAFFDTLYLSPFNEKGVPGDARNWVPLALFAFGVLSAVVFGLKFARMYRAGTDKTVTGWRSGISLACVVLGIYVAGAAVDHWLFFVNNENSGVASADGLGVGDIQCEQMVLVRLTESGADYRCPLSLSLGGMASKPFVPWPSYTSGHSKALKSAIDSATRAARERNASVSK